MFKRCPLCESSIIENLKKNEYFISRCSKCGLIFIPKDSIPFDLAKLYNESYFKGGVYRDYVKEKEYRIKIFEDKLQLVKRYFTARGRVLDVGCAAGFFLKIMKDKGYEVYGIDISEHMVSYATQVLKLNVVKGSLLDVHFPDEFFDIVTMWDVLEHLPNPAETLAEVYRIMKKGGILLVETLNTDSLLAKIMKDKWPLFKPPYHLFYFNKRAIRNLLENLKFNLIEIIPIQTYIKIYKGFKPLRYFKSLILRSTLGRVFDDVILIIAQKPYKGLEA